MSQKAPTTLGGFVLPVKSVSPSSLYGDDEFQYLDIASVDRDTRSILSPQTIKTTNAPSRARQLVQANDIIVSTVRPNLNTVAHVPAEYDGAIASTGFCVLRANPKVLDHRYLYHWISSQKSVDYLVSVATGASYPAVSDKIIKGMDFDPPSLEEQKRIAAILDKADSLRRKRAQAIALADDFLRATFLDLFGDPVTNPKGWVVKPLIELVDPDRPITYGILMPGEDQDDGVKYVRVVDMKDGGIDTTSVKKTTQAISDSYRRSLLKKGDLLMSIRGHVGRVASTPSDLEGANITQDTARLAIVGADPLYIKYFLRSPVMQFWMAQHTKGAAVKGINLTDVKRMPIQIPSPDSQALFARQVQKIESYLQKSAVFHCDASAGFAALQNEAM